MSAIADETAICTQVKSLIEDNSAKIHIHNGLHYRSVLSVKDSTGQEPLHYAAMMNAPEITKLLIEAGAVRTRCSIADIRRTHSCCQHQPHHHYQPSLDVVFPRS
jgi:ankyrin repeat protein